MKGILISCLLLFISLFKVGAQDFSKETAEVKPKKEIKYSKWAVRAGGNLSVVYLARNTKDWNNEPGFSLGALYSVNNLIRFSGLYTNYHNINIEPTWLNIKAYTYELNLEILARFSDKKTLMYPMCGFSYNIYKGFFTGQDDFLNLKQFYTPNSNITNHWLGMNFGLGIEHQFGLLGIYLDYRMKVGKQEKGFNIMDVCYSAGIKCRIPSFQLKMKKVRIFKTNDRFHWF